MGEAAAPKTDHLYGGQAVIEGVMMRGAAHWAVAVRRPSGDIHVESHDIDSIAKRHPLLAKPFLRGIIVLGQSMSIGMRALSIAANQSSEDEEQVSSKQMGVSLALALVLFVAVFVAGAAAMAVPVSRKADAINDARIFFKTIHLL